MGARDRRRLVLSHRRATPSAVRRPRNRDGLPDAAGGDRRRRPSAWRARAVGVYRLWRDGGFAVGALLAGVLAEAFGILSAIWVVAAITLASGTVVAVRMYETHRARPVRRGAAAA